MGGELETLQEFEGVLDSYAFGHSDYSECLPGQTVKLIADNVEGLREFIVASDYEAIQRIANFIVRTFWKS